MKLLLGKSTIPQRGKDNIKVESKYNFPHIILHARPIAAKKKGFLIELDPLAKKLLNFTEVTGQTIIESVDKETGRIFLINTTALDIKGKKEFSKKGVFSAGELYVTLCEKYLLNQEIDNYLKIDLCEEITDYVAVEIFAINEFKEITDEEMVKYQVLTPEEASELLLKQVKELQTNLL